ncbi:peroxiredoxin [Litorimonas taeanensis]|uniref:Peroxiredoxin n=1 Tax=Litorimonas taeanensis TaxID=568099 RepID=A0A420WIK7_9PROT|nr:redoxin domain-containing protein [Litorimonas taeanensis]RKQ70833.1 peroxiredoxin [Litorimonas taeanensis]
MPQLIMPKSKLPEIDFPLTEGGRFNVRDSLPEKFLILVVYRGYHCPKCKKQLQEINDLMPDIQADGLDLVAVSMDGEERAKKAKDEWALENVSVGYDLSLLEAKALGLFISDAISDKEPKFFSEPGIFVINTDGTLYAEIIQNTPFGRPDIKGLVAGLNFAKENDYPERGTSVV